VLVSATTAYLASDKQSGIAAPAGADQTVVSEKSGTVSKADQAASSSVQLSDKAKAVVRSLQARDQHEAAWRVAAPPTLISVDRMASVMRLVERSALMSREEVALKKLSHVLL
jgi:hypothetical protein